MKIQAAKTVIKQVFQGRQTAGLNQPVILWGAPGIGKSAAVKQAAAELGCELYDLRVTLLDHIDIRGLPSVQDGQTVVCPPSFLPTEGKGILFLDELPQGKMSIQNALFQLVLDRRLGDYVLPDGWIIVAAGNRLEDKSGVSERMNKALANRFLHIDIDVDTRELVEFGIQNQWHPLVASFLQWAPRMAHYSTAFADAASAEVVTLKDLKDDNAFPTPRAWEMVSNMLHATEAGDEVVGGIVGDRAAAQFKAFQRIWSKLPDLDNILARPEEADLIDSDPALRFALSGVNSKPL
jgi:MoxR-like ATPase